MSRRVIAAEIGIALLAILFVTEAAATIRLGDTSHGPRHAFVGELIQVGLRAAYTDVTTSNSSVVKPIGVTQGSPPVHYFIAAYPGKAILRSSTATACRGCLNAIFLWTVEIDVG